MLGHDVIATTLPAALALSGLALSADSAAELGAAAFSADLSADRADVPTLSPPVVLNESAKLVEMSIAAADHPMRYVGGIENVPASTLRDPAYLQSFVGKPVLFGLDHPRDERGDLRRYTYEADAERKIGVVVKSWFDEREQVQKAQVVIDTPQGLQDIASVRGVSPAYMKQLELRAGLTADGKRYDAVQARRSDVDHVLVTPNPRGGAMTFVRGADTQDGPMDPMKLAALLRKAGMQIEADADMKEDAFAKLVADACGAMMSAKDKTSADAIAAIESERDAEKARADKLEADAAADHTMAHYRAVRSVEASADSLGVKVDLSECKSLDEARRAVLKATVTDTTKHATIDGLSGDALGVNLDALVTLASNSKQAAVTTQANQLGEIKNGTKVTETASADASATKPCAYPFSSTGA